MRKSNMLVVATALASAMLTSTGGFSPADAAKISLNQCISNRASCRSACFAAQGPAGHSFPWTLGFQYCLNHCDDNHAACVDVAMGSSLSAGDGGPSKKPPKRPAEAAPPGGGLLQGDPGLSGQGPSRTGTGTGKPGGSGTIY